MMFNKESSTVTFRLTFSLTQVKQTTSEGFKRKNDSGIGNYISDDSFPIISTNSYKYKLLKENIFINYNASVKIHSGARSKEDSFRTRNRFIIARNLIGKLVTENNKDVNMVSKIVSLVWKNNEKQLKNYFEYLSLLESNWYKCYRFNLGNTSQVSNFVTNQARYDFQRPYSTMCSTSYTKPKLSTKKPSSRASPPQNLKFRISKDVTFAKNKTLKKDKFSAYQASFRIKNCFLSNSIGILTEDMFLNS